MPLMLDNTMKEVFLWCVNTRNKNKTNSFFTNSRWGLCYNPFYFVRKELYEGIAKHAPHLKGKLIDLGCGTKPYQHLFTQVESYTGLDIAVSGNSDGKSAIDLYYDGVTFPLENNSIDVLFSSETFEHIFNLPVIVAEIQRVVKPGGHILITCPFLARTRSTLRLCPLFVVRNYAYAQRAWFRYC